MARSEDQRRIRLRAGQRGTWTANRLHPGGVRTWCRHRLQQIGDRLPRLQPDQDRFVWFRALVLQHQRGQSGGNGIGGLERVVVRDYDQHSGASGSHTRHRDLISAPHGTDPKASAPHASHLAIGRAAGINPGRTRARNHSVCIGHLLIVTGPCGRQTTWRPVTPGRQGMGPGLLELPTIPSGQRES